MREIEAQIVSSLLGNEEYARRVIPFTEPEYFTTPAIRWMVDVIVRHVNRYDVLPDKGVLLTELDTDSKVDESTAAVVRDTLANMSEPDRDNVEWLAEATESFFRERALYNAMSESIVIADGEDPGRRDWGVIPGLLEDALAVSFDDRVGHDYFDDFEERWSWYHEEDVRIPFDIDILNAVTRGGIPRKTLNVFLAGTGVGKSLLLCHMAARNLTDGKNVLYVTLELSEKAVSERIDANLLNVSINSISDMSRDQYVNRMREIRNRTVGRLVVREFPTSAGHVGHVRNLLRELAVKRKFHPDVIYVDYLNICASYRYRQDGAVGSYFYVKSIAEEMRGLAVEHDVPVITATQTTRGAYASSDPNLDDTSESFGLPMTADFMAAIVTNEELQDQKLAMVKVLKNRYNRLDYNRRFHVGFDSDRMRVSNVDPVSTNGENPSGGETSNAGRDRFADFD